MSKRPDLFTSYQKEISIFPNNTQKFWFVTLLITSIYVCFIASDYWIILITNALLVSIAAWGLNIVSGLAGQINLDSGDFKFTIQSHNEKVNISLINDSFQPSTFINAEWEAWWHQRGRSI